MLMRGVVHLEGARSVAALEKRLSSRERGVEEAALRLRSEARLLELLAGRVTPRLLAAGEDEAGPFFRVEHVPFPSLADRLERRPDPAFDEAWIGRVVEASFAALAALHEADDELGPLAIIHADLSPANVLVDDAGQRVVLVDLELAEWRERPALRDGAFRGTVTYCAPEIARGEPARPASDLFAMAATLLHVTTNTAPRAAPSLGAMLALAGESPVLDATRRALASRGPAYAAIVACLAHDAEERPKSARHVLELLR
jgi:serine/threonine protein kinase